METVKSFRRNLVCIVKSLRPVVKIFVRGQYLSLRFYITKFSDLGKFHKKHHHTVQILGSSKYVEFLTFGNLVW